MVVRRGSGRKEGAASRRVHRRAAPPPNSKRSTPRPGCSSCSNGLRRRSEWLLLVRRRDGQAGRLDVPALFGAARVDEDAPGREGGLKALEAVGEDLSRGRSPHGAAVLAAVEAGEAAQPLGRGHPLLCARFEVGGVLEYGLCEEVAPWATTGRGRITEDRPTI